jgi:hypothetical protein
VKFKRNPDRSYVASDEGVDVKVWRSCRTGEYVARVSFTLPERRTLELAQWGAKRFIALVRELMSEEGVG